MIVSGRKDDPRRRKTKGTKQSNEKRNAWSKYMGTLTSRNNRMKELLEGNFGDVEQLRVALSK